MASIHAVKPVDVTPGDDVGLNSWQEVDVSAYLPPSGFTGVIIHYGGYSAAAYAQIGLRMKGSTDNRPKYPRYGSHFWAMIGVDANGKFEVYRNANSQKIYMVGYTTEGVTFFTNAESAGVIPWSPDLIIRPI